MASGNSPAAPGHGKAVSVVRSGRQSGDRAARHALSFAPALLHHWSCDCGGILLRLAAPPNRKTMCGAEKAIEIASVTPCRRVSLRGWS